MNESDMKVTFDEKHHLIRKKHDDNSCYFIIDEYNDHLLKKNKIHKKWGKKGKVNYKFVKNYDFININNFEKLFKFSETLPSWA